MNIQFVTSNINSLSLERFPDKYDEAGDELDRQFGLNYQTIYDDEDENGFINVFRVELIHPGEFKLALEYFSLFKTSEPIDESFKKSDFTSINAPAIAFPYLRSAISIITMTAGFKPAVLPTLNFIKFKEKNKGISPTAN